MFDRRFFLGAALAALLATAACSGDGDSPTEPTTPPPQGPAALQVTDLAVGEGAEAVANADVVVHYTLWHYDPAGGDGSKGAVVQSTAGSSPQIFRLNSASVIEGFVQGVVGMKVGGRRRFIIPPNLGWGATGNAQAGIQPNEWVVFEVELMSVV